MREQNRDERLIAPAQRRRRLYFGIVATAVSLLAVVLGVGLALSAGQSPVEVGGAPQGSAPTPQQPGATSSPVASDPGTPPADAQPEPREPVALEKPAELAPEVTASIGTIEVVQGEAKRPGEIAGPSVRFTTSISNSSGKLLDLRSTVVSVYYGSDEVPANQLEEPGGVPLPSDVSTGQIATGTYVFSIPPDQRSLVRIVVDYSVRFPPAVFAGSIPN